MNKETASTLGVILVLLVLTYGTWSAFQTPVIVQPPVIIQPIPSPTPNTSQSTSVTAQIGQGIQVLGITLTPLDILEDSRCPKDVMCIQAGTVQIRATILAGNVTTIQEFKLGTPVNTSGVTIELVAATPEPVSTTTRTPGEYRFFFQITRP